MKLIRRSFRHVAILLALSCVLGDARMASAQDSFFERFIRAGAPPPATAPKPQVAPTLRHPRSTPRYAAPSYPARRFAGRRPAGAKEAPDEPIKTKTNPSTAILVIGDALADRLAQ